ncbi:MAG: ComEA family DNA-binding protein [Anaerolineae bacterium]
MTDNPAPESSPRNTIIAFFIVVAAIVGGAVLLLNNRPAVVEIIINTPQPTPTRTPSPTPGPITVYVTGAVNQPDQLLTLPPGSRVQDAIDAAGGLASGADVERVNLADRLHDGDQVHVFSIGQDVSLATPSAGLQVYINTATAEELDALPGVGPALAAAIIAYRDANGGFTTLEQLDEVEGVGPALLEDWQGLIVFD